QHTSIIKLTTTKTYTLSLHDALPIFIHDPDPATVRCQHEIVITRLNCQIAHGDSGKMVAFELCPVFSAVNRYEQTKLGPKKKQIGLNEVFFNYVSVAAHAPGLLRCY